MEEAEAEAPPSLPATGAPPLAAAPPPESKPPSTPPGDASAPEAAAAAPLPTEAAAAAVAAPTQAAGPSAQLATIPEDTEGATPSQQANGAAPMEVDVVPVKVRHHATPRVCDAARLTCRVCSLPAGASKLNCLCFFKSICVACMHSCETRHSQVHRRLTRACPTAFIGRGTILF